MEDIIKWLDAGVEADYEAGVALLRKHSKNRNLVNYLARKASSTNREKLTYELIKCGCEGNIVDVSAVEKAMTVTAVLNAANVGAPGAPAVFDLPSNTLIVPVAPAEPDPVDVPEHLREQADDLTVLMQRIHNKRCQLSNTLADLTTPDEQQQRVAEILDLQKQYNALAEKRRLVLAGQSEPAPAPVEPDADTEPEPNAPVVDKAALVLELNNVRSNLSKAKGKLKKDPEDVRLQQKVAKLEVEKNSIEMTLRGAA